MGEVAWVSARARPAKIVVSRSVTVREKPPGLDLAARAKRRVALVSNSPFVDRFSVIRCPVPAPLWRVGQNGREDPWCTR